MNRSPGQNKPNSILTYNLDKNEFKLSNCVLKELKLVYVFPYGCPALEIKSLALEIKSPALEIKRSKSSVGD